MEEMIKNKGGKAMIEAKKLLPKLDKQKQSLLESLKEEGRLVNEDQMI